MLGKKILLVFVFGLILFSTVDAFGVNFIDHTGYIPDWAKPKGQMQVTLACLEIDYDTKDFAWCTEYNGYVLDKLMGTTQSVTFKDITGYTPDWAQTMGQNQATSTCINIDYLTRDFAWCMEYNGYVLDKLMGKIKEPDPPEKIPVEKPPEIKFPEKVQESPLKKYFLEMNKLASNWKLSGEHHTITDDPSEVGILNFYSGGYESNDGQDIFFIAITQFENEQLPKIRSNSFLEEFSKQIPDHYSYQGGGEDTNSDCSQIISTVEKLTFASSCIHRNFLITTISVVKSGESDILKLTKSVLSSINKDYPINTKIYQEKEIPKPELIVDTWPDSLLKSADTQTVGAKFPNGETEKVLVHISTDKDTYHLGDSIEWEVRMQSPWQEGYNFGILDDNYDHVDDFYNYEITSFDSGGITPVDIYPGGDGLFVNYYTGSNKVKIDNFWTEDLVAGEYTLTFQINFPTSTVNLDRTVNFKKLLHSTSIVPDWVKNNAKWWADGTIDDKAFVNAIQYLIKENIINIPEGEHDFETSTEIPSWIKRVAEFWSMDMISEDDFLMSIQFLIENGIIQLS